MMALKHLAVCSGLACTAATTIALIQEQNTFFRELLPLCDMQEGAMSESATH